MAGFDGTVRARLRQAGVREARALAQQQQGHGNAADDPA
jgi:hypothetical protein